MQSGGEVHRREVRGMRVDHVQQRIRPRRLHEQSVDGLLLRRLLDHDADLAPPNLRAVQRDGDADVRLVDVLDVSVAGAPPPPLAVRRRHADLAELADSFKHGTYHGRGGIWGQAADEELAARDGGDEVGRSCRGRDRGQRRRQRRHPSIAPPRRRNGRPPEMQHAPRAACGGRAFAGRVARRSSQATGHGLRRELRRSDGARAAAPTEGSDRTWGPRRR
mmetsp:Transcript_8662/g.30606  ORF Transcript_8662/g.30606 Transcript_8662/m.30606 type:complete len:220 (-) Transcript_8662:11-670(-)